MMNSHFLQKSTMGAGRLQSQQQTRKPKRWQMLAAMALCTLTWWGMSQTAFADNSEPHVASQYQAVEGEPFFLLTDTSYGSDEEAKVRVEVQPGSYNVNEYGGVDMLVYRISDPMAFLQKQKNLHRVQTDGSYVGEGMSNTLSYLWDSWYKRSRRMWQSLFDKKAREAVVEAAPELRTPRTQYQRTDFKPQPQYKPLAKENGFELVQQFRYPIAQAQSIKPLEDVKLDGSSSDFIPAQEGNVYVPVGKLKAGLYLVEGIVGKYRANTLLFVSDTVGVTKLSSKQLLLWAANRADSAAVADTQVFWTDGVGVLQSGKTNADGVAVFEHSSPERTYVMGQDPAGGVFISENFYYDSEIYNSKMYAVTDRPLYRPGDDVRVSIWGRDFESSSVSSALRDGAVQFHVLDPNGVAVQTQSLTYKQNAGAHTQFSLPANSTAGGYELRFSYVPAGASKNDAQMYSAAFRVVQYVKPHFSVHVQLAQENYQTGQPVQGELQLRYPDGKPVKNAAVDLSLRSQQLTMVEGEVAYAGMFPRKLETKQLTTDGDGNATFTLPAAKEPSRYALTAFASDGAALRVRTTKEILIERAASQYSLRAAKQFSQQGEAVPVLYELLTSQGLSNNTDAHKAQPTVLQWVRLEDQSKGTAELKNSNPDAGAVTLKLPKAGSYSLTLRDAHNNILGGTTHWVAGAGLQVVPGSIELVTDKPKYQIGEVAEVLISFAEPVQDALLTLERDAVAQHALASRAEQGGNQGGNGSDWLQLKRLSPTQLQARIKVQKAFAPNMTFSVAYSKGGQFVFENRGLVVEQPSIALKIDSDKPVYAPGETVQLTVQTTQNGKPVPAQVALGMVDEMVYVLQPEIAPRINDFFYHARRNNVRTTSSLAFISYDMATGKLVGAPARSSTPQRGVKVLERPRREEVDTAYWNGALTTGADGKLTVSVRMPDSLTRWRVTARAIQPQSGLVGQTTAYVRSSKDFYTKWTSPDWMREGDTPTITWAAFNQTNTPQQLQYRSSVNSSALGEAQNITLQPGANTISLALPDRNSAAGKAFAHDAPLKVELLKDGKVVDALEKYVDGLPDTWQFANSQTIPIDAGATALPIELPKDARNIRLRLVNSVDGEFERIAQDLMDYPYGCVEQTASRLIPLSMMLPAMKNRVAAATEAGNKHGGLLKKQYNWWQQQLQHNRLRLVYMAGSEGTFGWWGNQVEGDVLMTAYAYYADWQASKVLGINLPAEHWQPMLALFDPNANAGKNKRNIQQKNKQKRTLSPLTERVMALWLAQQMGMPTDNILRGLVDEWRTTYGMNAVVVNQSQAAKNGLREGISPLLAEPNGAEAKAMALVLLDDMLLRSKKVVGNNDVRFAAQDTARALLNSPVPSMQTLAFMYEKNLAGGTLGADFLHTDIRGALQRASSQSATFDKALALIFARDALGTKALTGGAKASATEAPFLDKGWVQTNPLPNNRSYVSRLDGVPSQIEFMRPAPAGWSAVVSYDSAAQTQPLPITMQRTLYRLTPTGKAGQYTTSAVQAGDTLHTDALYLDKIELKGNGKDNGKGADKNTLRHALLEVPLPPGAEVEATTWGIRLLDDANADEGQKIERAQHEPMRSGYAVPLAKLSAADMSKGTTIRHLVRFAQKGTFSTPPARLYSMYQPHRVAVDGKGRQFRVE